MTVVMSMMVGSLSRTLIMPEERRISRRQRYKLSEMVMNRLSLLPESNKILIVCLLYSFSHPGTNHIDLYIEWMGLTDVKRNAIEVRKRRALDRLRELLGGKRPDYHDIYVSLRRSYDNADDTSDTMPNLPEDGMLGYNGMRKRMSSIKSPIPRRISKGLPTTSSTAVRTIRNKAWSEA